MYRLLPRSVIAPLLLAAVLLPIVIILTVGMSYCLVALDDVWGATALRYLTVVLVILWVFDFILLVLTLGVFALESCAEYEVCEEGTEETKKTEGSDAESAPDDGVQESPTAGAASDESLSSGDANAASS